MEETNLTCSCVRFASWPAILLSQLVSDWKRAPSGHLDSDARPVRTLGSQGSLSSQRTINIAMARGRLQCTQI